MHPPATRYGALTQIFALSVRLAAQGLGLLRIAQRHRPDDDQDAPMDQQVALSLTAPGDDSHGSIPNEHLRRTGRRPSGNRKPPGLLLEHSQPKPDRFGAGQCY